MVFNFDISNELKAIIIKLEKRDKKIAKRVNKKIKEIMNCDITTINHYKNLKYDLKEYKRVHIGHFVLVFKVYSNNLIIFTKFKHPDDVYK